MTTRTPPQHIKHQQAADRQAWLRDQLVQFTTWMAIDQQVVDEYLSRHKETDENPRV